MRQDAISISGFFLQSFIAKTSASQNVNALNVQRKPIKIRNKAKPQLKTGFENTKFSWISLIKMLKASRVQTNQNRFSGNAEWGFGSTSQEFMYESRIVLFRLIWFQIIKSMPRIREHEN